MTAEIERVEIVESAGLYAMSPERWDELFAELEAADEDR